MKKYLGYLVLVLLTLYVAGRIVPASAVHAANETQLVASSTSPSEKEAAPNKGSAQPVVFIVTGCVCVLFGIVAVSPLLIFSGDKIANEGCDELLGSVAPVDHVP
jgi:hypothetical protein